MSSHQSTLNGSGRETISANFNSDVRYIERSTYTTTWHSMQCADSDGNEHTSFWWQKTLTSGGAAFPRLTTMINYMGGVVDGMSPVSRYVRRGIDRVLGGTVGGVGGDENSSAYIGYQVHHHLREDFVTGCWTRGFEVLEIAERLVGSQSEIQFWRAYFSSVYTEEEGIEDLCRRLIRKE